jgi:hypothetical protein
MVDALAGTVRVFQRGFTSPNERALGVDIEQSAGERGVHAHCPQFLFRHFPVSFRFNPGTNGGNVEMRLINESYLLTLNQRVQGSNPCAPTHYQAVSVGRRFHSDKAISCHSDKMAAFAILYFYRWT